MVNRFYYGYIAGLLNILLESDNKTLSVRVTPLNDERMFSLMHWYSTRLDHHAGYLGKTVVIIRQTGRISK